MNTLNEIINSLSNNDKKLFISYLKAESKRKTYINVQLFEILKTDDINALNKFKEHYSQDAYHALRKRLYDSLINFIGNRSFESDTSKEHEVLRLLVASRTLLEQKLTAAAFKSLAKAETIALQLEHFSLLNEIYHTQVQYAHLNPAADLKSIIERFSANRQKLQQEEQLNLAYAVLRKELAEIYHEGKITNLQQAITATMKAYGIVLEEVLNFKALYQILFIANEFASINSNFSTIESFVIKSYNLLADKKETAERHLYYQIYILYFMANLHFRNRKYEQSGNYLEQMEALLQKQNGRYYNRFILRHALLTALNHQYTGNPGMAIDTVEKALAATASADVVDIADLQLAITMFYIQTDAPRVAHKQMNALAQTDNWYEKKMGMDWTIKKKLAEIVIHTHLENTELALSLIAAFKRRYKKYLAAVKEHRVFDYVILIEHYILKPKSVSTDDFKKSCSNLLDLLQQGHTDIFVISFMAWLWAKVTKKPIYEVTLDLANNYFSPSHSA